MVTKVLHIIEGVSSGGASRNTLTMANYSKQFEDVQHNIVSLMPASNDGRLMASRYGVRLIDAPPLSTLIDKIAESDIIQLSYWNCPIVTKFMNLRLPPMRLSIWFRIFGAHPPQMITEALIEFADVAIMTSLGSLTLPACQSFSKKDGLAKPINVVLAPADFERISNIESAQRNTFNVGYIGTIDFVKMHPNYIVMSNMIKIPNINFIICGKGAIDNSTEQRLRQQVHELGKDHVYDFRGYIDNIKSVLSELDVFGYPLCKETFATSEATLQEVMYAGIPPVVFPYGGVSNLVINHETGIIVHDEEEYAAAIMYLYENPDQRKRMGKNAKSHAEIFFGAKNTTVAMNQIYSKMMEIPKRRRISLVDIVNQQQKSSLNKSHKPGRTEMPSGAECFAASLGSYGNTFFTNLYSENDNEILASDAEIASWASSFLMTSPGYGSVFHYRNIYPGDPHLHLWCGLILLKLQKYNNAVFEFQAAINLGFTSQRLYTYLSRALTEANKNQI